MCWMLGGDCKCLSTDSKTADVLSLQVSLAVVTITTVSGCERQGDQVVKFVGCDVVSAASMMLFNSVFKAT